MTFSLSHSELKTWARCPRSWFLAYYRKLQLKNELPTGVVHIGSHIHLALEGYHGYGLDPLAVLRWSYENVITDHPEHEKQLRKDLDLALAMTEGYVTWCDNEGINAGLKVVATEHEITHETWLPVAKERISWRGKLDVLFQRESDGRYVLRDYKTVGGFEKSSALLIDQQMRFYAMLLAFAFPDARERFTGAMYLMIKRSKRTARATGPFYQQAEVAYNNDDLNSTYLRALSVSEKIADARRKLDGEINTSSYDRDHRFTCPPNVSDYCTWGCPFFRMCHLMDDGSRWESMAEAEYRVGDPYHYYDTGRIRQATAELSHHA